MAAASRRRSAWRRRLAAEVVKLAQTVTTTEHSFRPVLNALFSAFLPSLTPVNEAKRQACGAPGFILFDRNKLSIMFVETKDLGDNDLDGKRRAGNKEQFDRYKAALETIDFTDFPDFHFYRHGQSAGEVRIADQDGTEVAPPPGAFAAFVSMMEESASGGPQRIDSVKRLAELMAGKARMLRHCRWLVILPRKTQTAFSILQFKGLLQRWNCLKNAERS